ncbi:MAG: hypothetical protein ACRC33_10565 [Gemmataceae bacterium]
MVVVLFGPEAGPPPRYGSHTFAPIDPGWRVATELLRPDRDPPTMWKPVAEDDPEAAKCMTLHRYFEKGEGRTPVRVRMVYPSGRLARETDNVGSESHARYWADDGRETCYVHGRDDVSLNGWSVGPSGERHRLKGGYGELIFYGQAAGNRIHAWYAGGSVLVQKRYLGDKLILISLIGPRPDGGAFHVGPDGEMIALYAGQWLRLKGKPPAWQPAGLWAGRRSDPDRPYKEERTELMKRVRKMLGFAGLSWEDVGLTFLPSDKPWPK